MASDIRKILQHALNAPSGENLQPWRFEISKNEIRVYLLPDRDNSLYSWGRRSLFFAHGALIENISILAASEGLESKVSLFPEDGNFEYTAKISFWEGGQKHHPLAEAVPVRMTNRKPYENVLQESVRKNLEQSVRKAEERGVAIALKYAEEDKKSLARAISVNEEVLFKNRKMHQFFFSHINWSAEEEREKRIGLSVETLEFDEKQARVFKMLRNWKVAKILGGFGIGKLIAKDNAKITAQGGALGAVILKNTDPASYILAGRVFERVWLECTRLGLSLQPFTGVCFLHLLIKEGGGEGLSKEGVAKVEEAYAKVRAVFNIHDDFIACLFRVGVGDAPSAHSLKKLPDVHYEV